MSDSEYISAVEALARLRARGIRYRRDPGVYVDQWLIRAMERAQRQAVELSARNAVQDYLRVWPGRSWRMPVPPVPAGYENYTNHIHWDFPSS